MHGPTSLTKWSFVFASMTRLIRDPVTRGQDKDVEQSGDLSSQDGGPWPGRLESRGHQDSRHASGEQRFPGRFLQKRVNCGELSGGSPICSVCCRFCCSGHLGQMFTPMISERLPSLGDEILEAMTGEQERGCIEELVSPAGQLDRGGFLQTTRFVAVASRSPPTSAS